MRNIFFLLGFLFSFIASGQTFNGTGGAITDASTVPNCFNVNVTGLPNTTGSTFGLATVCINITHTWDSDLDITLTAPNGTIIPLSMGNGGSGNNYNGTCFNMSAPTNIAAGTAPFAGTYIPDGNLGIVNNGQNPNGTWSLCVLDGSIGDFGTVRS